MKINKLFHWLYAGLMLLPLFGVLFTSLYVSFNPNAKDSYSEYYNIENQLVTLNNFNDVILNQEYILDTSNVDFTVNASGVSYLIGFDNANWTIPTYAKYMTVGRSSGHTNQWSITYYDSNKNYLSYVRQQEAKQFKFIIFEIDRSNYGADNSFQQATIQTYTSVREQGTLDNAFTYAVNQINENPLYSWAQSSFLVAPIAYITAIFGLASTSPIVTLLSYWLTISIVWLCFDLIMYIPLLVHRWLDKGILE